MSAGQLQVSPQIHNMSITRQQVIPLLREAAAGFEEFRHKHLVGGAKSNVVTLSFFWPRERLTFRDHPAGRHFVDVIWK